VIISVVEGEVNARDGEKEFNDGFFLELGGTESLSPMQFSMRFPNPKEVECACYWGEKNGNENKIAILNLST
jgi:hypothetical protein